MSTAKLNAVGHRWVGELSDFRFDIKYKPDKVNIDTDTLSHLPLGIDQLSGEAVRATWQGKQAAQGKDIAWVAALHLSQDYVEEQYTHEPLPTIDHGELEKAQRDDQAIRELLILKETNRILTSEARQGVSATTKKLMHEWGKTTH